MVRLPPASARIAFGCCALLLEAGCEETVALGTECPPFGDVCIVPRPQHGGGVPPLDASAALIDSGNDRAQPRDAGEPTRDAAGADASTDGQDAGTLALDVDNPSFELTKGSGGEVTTTSSNAVEPWYTCRSGLSVAPEADLRNLPVGTPAPDELAHPTDGAAFVSTSFFLGTPTGTELLQRLRTPLEAGRRYAFLIDVRSASGGLNNIAFEVWGAVADCLPLTRLASSRAIMDDEGWVPVCVTFTPNAAYPQIALEARAVSGTASPGSRLFYDNLRTSPDCH